MASTPAFVQAAPRPGCPVTIALGAIGGKWNIICLDRLSRGALRFSELQGLMLQISPKVLTQTLRDLEEQGLITRTRFREHPPRVEYAISAYGRSLLPLLEAVRTWGHAHLERRRRSSIQIARY